MSSLLLLFRSTPSTDDSGTVVLTLTPSAVELPTLHLPLVATFDEGTHGNLVPVTAGTPSFSRITGTPVYKDVDGRKTVGLSNSTAPVRADTINWLNVEAVDRTRFRVVARHGFSGNEDAIEFMNLFNQRPGTTPWEAVVFLQADFGSGPSIFLTMITNENHAPFVI